MTCSRCGTPLEPKDIPEPSDSGSFVETYECPQCGANRYVSGQENEPPQHWDEWGSAV